MLEEKHRLPFISIENPFTSIRAQIAGYDKYKVNVDLHRKYYLKILKAITYNVQITLIRIWLYNNYLTFYVC
jgi:hypothetical protein